jgi:hypothetical protein
VVPDFSNPQSLNRYAYVLGNPLGYVDPDGHWPEPPEDGPGRPVSVQRWNLAGGVRVLGSLIGLSEWSVSLGGTITQLGEWIVPGALVGAMDGPAPVGEAIVALPALATYKMIFDPVEDTLGWVGLGTTVAADWLAGYSYWDFSGDIDQWEIVIGQNTVEDLGAAGLGEVTTWVPIGLIDLAINTPSMLDGFKDILGIPNSEWVIELIDDPELLNPFMPESFLNIYKRIYEEDSGS